MILGMSAFTFGHVLLSLVMLVAGLAVVIAFTRSRKSPFREALFLLAGIATSATGFGFPFTKLLPSHVVGMISLVLLGVAIIARYAFQAGGVWRSIYVICILIAFYLDAFVAIVQAFQKIPVLHAMVLNQTEAPFVITQLLALYAFVLLGIAAMKRFHPARG